MRLPQWEDGPLGLRLYGALCSVRLSRVGALGDFKYRESLDRYLDGLFDESCRSSQDRKRFIRARQFFYGDDVTMIKYYQSVSIGIALWVGDDEPEESRPLSARAIMFATANAWSNIDFLGCGSEDGYFTDREMRSQSEDIMDIARPSDGVDRWILLRDRARSAGEEVAASLTGLARDLRWADELGIPGFHDKTAQEVEDESFASLVERDAPPDQW